MKTKLSLLFLFVVLSATIALAQNNDMKARMEYEDAETAYQGKDYQKTVTHLESAEKLLGKPMAKTRYLLILALSKNFPSDYEYETLEKLRTLCKHYLDNYTTDQEKYRDIYDLSNNLKNYPDSFEDYKKLQEQRYKEYIENVKKSQDFIRQFAKEYGFKEGGLSILDFLELNPAYKNSKKALEKSVNQAVKLEKNVEIAIFDDTGKDWKKILINSEGKIINSSVLIKNISANKGKEFIKNLQNKIDERLYVYNDSETFIFLGIKIPGMEIGLEKVCIAFSRNVLQIEFGNHTSLAEIWN